MQSIKALTILFTLSFLLTACSSGSSDNSNTFKVGSVSTDIVHYHQSFYGKWGTTPNSTIRFTISVNVSDPKGADNLSDLYFRDKVADRYWDMLGGQGELTKEECYISSLDIYECRYYSSISLDSVNLKNWEIIAENKQGEVSRKDFEFLLPSGDPVEGEQFVYSSAYNGSTQNGIAALEAMTITNNGLKFSSNPGTQSFHIEFESSDNHAARYSFAFYNGTADIDYIARVRSDSPSIESMPIILGQTISIDIPWSEVIVYDNSTISDINGVHIKLYDEPIEWQNDKLWHNYISYSEFVTLSP